VGWRLHYTTFLLQFSQVGGNVAFDSRAQTSAQIAGIDMPGNLFDSRDASFQSYQDLLLPLALILGRPNSS
jgi:hypothetical protein